MLTVSQITPNHSNQRHFECSCLLDVCLLCHPVVSHHSEQWDAFFNLTIIRNLARLETIVPDVLDVVSTTIRLLLSGI